MFFEEEDIAKELFKNYTNDELEEKFIENNVQEIEEALSYSELKKTNYYYIRKIYVESRKFQEMQR